MHTIRLRYILGCLILSQQLYATPAVLIEHTRAIDETTYDLFSDNYAHQVPLNVLGRSRTAPVTFPRPNTAIVNVSYEQLKIVDKPVIENIKVRADIQKLFCMHSWSL